MVCELLIAARTGVESGRPTGGAAISVGGIFILDRFPGNGAPFTLNGRRGRSVTRL
jgi:hypothetical protein